MLRSRFLWRLLAGYSSIVVLASTVVWFLAAAGVAAETRHHIDRTLLARAQMLEAVARPALAGSAPTPLQPTVVRLGVATGSRLTVIAADGRVLADSLESPARMDDHSNRPEVLAARQAGHGAAERFSATAGTTMAYHAVAVRDGERIVGFARASLPMTELAARLARLRGHIGVGAVLALGLALLLGLWAARRVAQPLQAMTAAAEAMAQESSGARVPETGPGELGDLARAINRLADHARSRLTALQTGRQEVEAILAGMVEGVVAVDADERVVHCNGAAASMLRVEGAPPVGQRVWEATRVHEVCEVLIGALRDATLTSGELRLVEPGGDRVVEMRAAPLREGRGAVVVLHDISELARLEGMRREFVANVSHELKTPIAAIRGLVETILDDGAMDVATRTRFLERARAQTLRLGSLVTDLLALSRLDAPDADLDLNELDLRETVAASVAALPAVGEQAPPTLDMPEAVVPVRGDEEALRQAIGNLLDNARKYAGPTGAVQVRLVVEGDTAVVVVEDDGPGIAPEHHARLFERFYRVDKARSRELGGTGLGLAIVKHVALAHGGQVAVESAPGQGAAFQLRLPCSGDRRN